MAMEHPKTPEVFVSYSHSDEKFLTELLTQLQPLKQRNLLDCWNDKEIEPGQLWRQEVERALASAKVAVLLVSPAFLASSFISQNELPPLLKAARNGRLKVLWIPVSSSNYKYTEIADFQAVHPPTRPLDRLKRSDRQRSLVAISEKIMEALTGIQTSLSLDSSQSSLLFELGSAEQFKWSSRGEMHRINDRLVSFVGRDSLKIRGISASPHRVNIEATPAIYARLHESFLSGDLDSQTGVKWKSISALKDESTFFTPEQTPLTFCGEYEENFEGRSIVCHLSGIEGFDVEYEEGQSFVGATTTNIEQARVYLTKQGSTLYAHSNFLKPECFFPTKIMTEARLRLLTLLANLVFVRLPSETELIELRRAHALSVEYFVNEITMRKEDAAFYCGAMNVRFVEPDRSANSAARADS